jgi:hypothetical protein
MDPQYLEEGAGAFFALTSAKQKLRVGARRKTSAKKTKTPSAKEKSANLHFSSLGQTTLTTQFQSTKPQAGGSNGLEQDVNKI